jgi:hypothetical protein
MKYFPPTKSGFHSLKVNFVDESNLVVGFDFSSNCCEDFGWLISENLDPGAESVAGLDDTATTEHINKELEGWVFDPKFYLELMQDDKYKERNYAVFRMFNKNQSRYLHLYNIHNGYYSHGFEFTSENEVIQKGYL